MKKYLSKIMPAILSLSMIFSMTGQVSAKDYSAGGEKDLVYVNLGGSNSNGYGLHGYLPEAFYEDPISNGGELSGPRVSGMEQVPEGCYADLVSKKLQAYGYNVKLHQLAQSSMRCEELRVLLDNDYDGDAYTAWRFYQKDAQPGGGKWWNKPYEVPYSDGKTLNGINDFRKYYQDCIKEADLITYDLGINNFGVYLSNMLMTNNTKFSNDLHEIMDSKYADHFYECKEQLINLGKKLGIDLGDSVSGTLDTIAYAYIGFVKNFDITMEKIHELNPDATIITLSIQNTLSDIKIKIKNVEIPFGDIFGLLSQMGNKYISSKSKYRNMYSYVNLGKGHVGLFVDDLLAYDGDVESLSEDMRDCYDVLDSVIGTFTRPAIKYQASVQGWSEELTNKAIKVAHDAETRILKALAKNTTLVIDDLLDKATMDSVEDEIIDIIYKGVFNSIAAAASGQDPNIVINDVISKFESKDIYKAIGSYLVRTSIGNTFFCHPNRVGHIQVYNAIIKVFTKELTRKVDICSQYAKVKGPKEIYAGINTEYEVETKDGFKINKVLINGKEVEVTDNKFVVNSLENVKIKVNVVKVTEKAYTSSIMIKGQEVIAPHIKNVIYKTTNKKVATVSQLGKIKALKSGNAIVTAQDKNGNILYTHKIEVINPELEVGTDNIILSKGAALKINAVTNTNLPVVYKSTNLLVAKVNKNGEIKALNRGICKIIVSTYGVTKTIVLNVK